MAGDARPPDDRDAAVEIARGLAELASQLSEDRRGGSSSALRRT